MADLDDVRSGRNFYPDVPVRKQVFPVKGTDSLDWGMKNRLARIFDGRTSRTVMLAIDHGYFQGPTTGLERIDISIPPLLTYAGRVNGDTRHATRIDPTRNREADCTALQFRAERTEGVIE